MGKRMRRPRSGLFSWGRGGERASTGVDLSSEEKGRRCAEPGWGGLGHNYSKEGEIFLPEEDQLSFPKKK